MKTLLAVIACVALASCYSLETKDWGEWADPDLAAQSPALAATLDWSKWPGVIVSIDQHGEVATGYKSARIGPGVHLIEYSAHPHDFGHVLGQIRLAALAGHAYGFHLDTCYWCTPRKFAVWVKDLTTGEIVWGHSPDWPRWYLYRQPVNSNVGRAA